MYVRWLKLKTLNLDNILLDEKSNLISDSRIRFDKINRYVSVYNGTRYLVSFVSKKYNFIYNRIRYLLAVKSGIIYVIPYTYAKIKVDSYDSLPLEKAKTFS